MRNNSKANIGDIIRELREKEMLPLRKVAAQLDIDTSFLSKIERNERRATKQQIIKLSEIFKVEKDYLMIPFLRDWIYEKLYEEDCASKVLKVTEDKILYNKNTLNS